MRIWHDTYLKNTQELRMEIDGFKVNFDEILYESLSFIFISRYYR